MARIRSKHSANVTISCKFGGLGKHTPLSPIGAEDMCNFQILPNGVLKVRSGYALKKRFSSGGKVRGVWEGTLRGTSFLFAVVGNTIYRLSGDALTETNVGTLTAGSENVHFCVFEDSLYLLDGKDILEYSTTSNKFLAIEPYVPLYGYMWSPTNYGDVNEEINLLSPRMRVHYYNSTAATTFTLPYYADSVDVVYVDNKQTTNFSFSKGSNKITFQTAPLTMEVGFTVSLNEELRADILASQMSFIYARDGSNKLLLWGNDGRLFCSRSVTMPMMSSCRALYPKASSLYFCMEDILFLGDNAHPIRTICHLYETLLVFTSDRIWNLSFEKGEIQATLSMTGMGCASPLGAISYDNGVMAAMDGGIYHITASPARPEELFLDRLSLGIDKKFSAGFTEKVHLMRNFAEGEIWMRDPSNTAGEVWIWNTEVKEWYRFDGIAASFFFKSTDGIGFASGNDIYILGRSHTTDNGSAIQAFYKSTYLDFGVPDSIRRSMRAFLYASPSKSDCEVLLETEQKEEAHQFSSDLYATTPQLHDMRISTHRYRFLRFTLSTSAKHPTEFYRLDIYSRP